MTDNRDSIFNRLIYLNVMPRHKFRDDFEYLKKHRRHRMMFVCTNVLPSDFYDGNTFVNNAMTIPDVYGSYGN